MCSKSPPLLRNSELSDPGRNKSVQQIKANRVSVHLMQTEQAWHDLMAI